MRYEGFLGEHGVVPGTIQFVSDKKALAGFALIRCFIEPRLIVSSALVGRLLAPFAFWLDLITFHFTL